MDGEDPEKRIAELEHQLAEQKRIAELQRELADARAGTGTVGAVGADAGRQPANVILTPRRFIADPGSIGPSFRDERGGPGSPGDRRRSPRPGGTANKAGAIGGAVGLCVGAAAALTAVLPSSASWTSAIVCGSAHRLMVDTSHYSYKPGQSGTSIGFACLDASGAQDASFVAITGLQTLLTTVVLGAVVAVGVVVRRTMRRQPVGPSRVMIAAGLGLVAAVAVATVWWQAAGSGGSVAIPQGGTLTIEGNGETKTIACGEGHLTVSGRAETVTVTGHCSSIKVSGVINRVTVDSVDAITTGGVGNVVTYHSGSPQLTNGGARNTVGPG